MPTWLDEWMILYIVLLTTGNIAVLTFLHFHNRRKNRGIEADKPAGRPQIKSEVSRGSS